MSRGTGWMSTWMRQREADLTVQARVYRVGRRCRLRTAITICTARGRPVPVSPTLHSPYGVLAG
ncbi:MAG: hypothetical protein WKF73_16950, partial [Nocardioidaceae bacterium]